MFATPCTVLVNNGVVFVQTYPVAGAVLVGLGFMTYTIVRSALYDPDVHWSKDERCAQPYDRVNSVEEGKKWAEEAQAKSRWNRPGVDVGAVSVFEAWSKPAKQDGLAKVHGPFGSAAPATKM